MKGYHALYASLERIAKITYLKENHYDNKRIAYNSTYYNILDLNTLGAGLSRVAAVLEVGEETGLLFDSENHTMAFTVIRKKAVDSDQYIIKFYDPNKTDNHTRVICGSLDDMKKLSINHLLSRSSLESYFQSHKYVGLFSPKQRLKAEEPLVVLSGFNIGAQLIYCMWFGLSNIVPSVVKKYLANAGSIIFPTTSKGTHLLRIAYQEKHYDAINAFINTINQSNLSSIEKDRILDRTILTLIKTRKAREENVAPNDQNAGKNTDRVRLLIDTKFDEHLKNFKHKANEMNSKAKFNCNYEKAKIKANEFCLSLERAKERFLDNPHGTFQEAKNTFKEDCDRAVKDARETLDAHREWKGAIWKFFINVLSFITRGLTESKLGFFAKTTSSKMLDTFEKDINCCRIPSNPSPICSTRSAL